MYGRWSSTRTAFRVLPHVHGVTHCRPFKDYSSVVAGDGGAQFGNRFVLACFGDFNASGDDVAGTDRCLEIPIDIEEHGPRARELLGDNGVQDGTGDAALNDNFPKARGLSRGLVIMERVTVPADLSEMDNVVFRDPAREFCALADFYDPLRPCCVHGDFPFF